MSAASDMIYRMTSGDATHVSPNALDRHVQADEHGKIIGLLFQPETRDVERALSFAILVAGLGPKISKFIINFLYA
jgi:hypothetical protein